MKIIRNLIDKTKPQFEKGGKYEKWLPIYESFETFFFVPATITKKGSHIRDAIDMKRSMIIVIIALLPALIFGMWNIGDLYFLSIGEQSTIMDSFFHGFLKVLPLIVVSYGVGLGVEFIFVYIRGHEINEGFLVTGMLIPLIVPIDIPLWMLGVATAFAVLIGKEAFGGTGMNIVNPALLARAFLFFAYPSKMSGDTVWINGLANNPNIVDGFTGETLLGQKANGISEGY
ncbi:MAG TPA: RnfABCDGE type electron transport complex subunit D, partial [Bacteroidales bacterium]|nr:RnfABCDGE type electron transport complex subunit D [Bacteroidales bacterium]